MQFAWFAMKNPDLLAERLDEDQVEIIAPTLHGLQFPSRLVPVQQFLNAAQLETVLRELREERDLLETGGVIQHSEQRR